MLNIYWPILLAVFADLCYQISAKSIPQNLNPFASLTVTYVVAAIVSAAFFFVASGGQYIIAEYKKINWTAFVLGLAIVGLEVGSIYMYKVGWNINTGYIVKSMILAIALIGVGYILYKEPITYTKVCGVAICLFGLFLINK